MTDREALENGKVWRRKLHEGQALFVEQEELKQFMDCAVYALEKLNERI